MKYLISGYKGFVGQYLMDTLSRSGKTAIGIGEGKDVSEADYFEGIKTEAGDVLIHLANKSFVPESWSQVHRYFDVNLMGTIQALEFCKKNQLGIVFLSSYLYGDPDYFPLDEKHPVKTNNPYALSKKMCEEMIAFYGQNFNVPYNIIRPFNIYGKGQKSNYLIPIILEQVLTEDSGKISLMDTKPKRDFIHVQDVADAIVLAADHLKNDIFNVCSGHSISIGELCKKIIDISGRHLEVEDKGEIRKNEIMDCYGSYQKIKDMLGWTPLISLEQGLKASMNN